MTSHRLRRHAPLLNLIPSDILDALTQSDLVVLKYLDRVAREGGGEACIASIPKIAKACRISARQVQISVGRLITAGLVEREGYDLSNADKRKRGTIYKVCTVKVPEEKGLSRREVMRIVVLLIDTCSAFHECVGQLALMLQMRPDQRRSTTALLRRFSKDVKKLGEVLNGEFE